ncbi:hypothetical protein LCGC14_2746560, partial [marine sediment metagenome]
MRSVRDEHALLWYVPLAWVSQLEGYYRTFHRYLYGRRGLLHVGETTRMQLMILGDIHAADRAP